MSVTWSEFEQCKILNTRCPKWYTWQTPDRKLQNKCWGVSIRPSVAHYSRSSENEWKWEKKKASMAVLGRRKTYFLYSNFFRNSRPSELWFHFHLHLHSRSEKKRKIGRQREEIGIQGPEKRDKNANESDKRTKGKPGKTGETTQTNEHRNSCSSANWISATRKRERKRRRNADYGLERQQRDAGRLQECLRQEVSVLDMRWWSDI